MFTSEEAAGFSGEVNPAYDHPALRRWVQRLPDVADLTLLREGEHEVYRAPAPVPGGFPVAVKIFAPQAKLAQTAYIHSLYLASQGGLAPTPLAWRASGISNGSDREILVTEFLPGVVSFREALLRLYHEQPLCREIVRLLETVARAIRQMHHAGFEHRDLGNDSILVRMGEGETDSRAWVMDVGRGVIGKPLTDRQRGMDNARISLPSDLRRIFFEMQYTPHCVPAAFFQGYRERRRRPTFQTTPATAREELPEQDIWIWDDRSMQAIPALRGKDKRKYYRAADGVAIVLALAKRGRAIRRARDDLMREAWSRPVPLKGRVGLSLNLEPERFEKERRWLTPLGPIPLLVRLYHHETEARRRYAVEAVRKLNAEGHTVTVALVQDRRAVLFPGKWAAFVESAGAALSGFVEAFETGHAVNRVKWGLWNFEEYRTLMSPFLNWSDRFPQIPLWGPAGIDFEYHRVLPLLDRLPDGARWSAFSHHLYVDRRGAPENEQSGYDTVRKLALARAMARCHPRCDERVIVSEVNWPLKGTGVWSPVGSPYVSPGPRTHDPSVDEDTYAAYMIRYLLLALCSGMADRVYWWNLAAHGFGLIDDRDPQGWRPRPAYHAFKDFLENTENAEFRERVRGGSGEPEWLLRLVDANGQPLEAGWDARTPMPPSWEIP